MRIASTLIASLALIGVIGCSGSSPTTGPNAVAKNAEGKTLVGKWRGKVEIAPEKKDDPAAKMAESMSAMFGDFLLEIKEGNAYTLAVMGVPTEGSLAMKGNDLTMTPQKIMGKTIEEFNKLNAKNGKPAQDAGNPMTGTASADGESITVIDPKKPETRIVFKRDTTKPREIGASTVKGDETALVGAYKTEIDPKKLKPEDKDMTEAMVATASLELFQDNSFTMNMMMLMEGVWKAEGEKLTLTLRKMNGVEEKADSGNKPISMTIQDGKLIPDPDGSQIPPFFFVKK